MRIVFFTPRSIEPLHPRLRSFQTYFQSKGFQVDFINKTNNTALGARINWLSLGFFDNYAIRKCQSLIDGYDIVFVTDMRYLPIAKLAKQKGKVVFYDTIDFNVHLRLYWLDHKVPILKPFRNFLMSRYSRIEKSFAQTYCDEILVNSNSLADYFGPKATKLFYSSPLEKIAVQNNPAHPAALLYLGAFIEEKGASDVLAIQKELSHALLFIFGQVEDPALLNTIQNDSSIHYSPRISSADLTKKLEELLAKYYLIGFSLIRPAHYSYEVQEANKDIDYIAMGIPIIGNDRQPTREKIENGCGINYRDPTLSALVGDISQRKKWTLACKEYYATHYAEKKFDETLDQVVGKYLSTASVQ